MVSGSVEGFREAKTPPRSVQGSGRSVQVPLVFLPGTFLYALRARDFVALRAPKCPNDTAILDEPAVYSSLPHLRRILRRKYCQS
jgi:hypothetical protein